MERPGDVVLAEVVGAVASVPRVLATGPGQLVREGGDEVVECPGYDGVIVGGDIKGNDADGIANAWTEMRKAKFTPEGCLGPIKPKRLKSQVPGPRSQPFMGVSCPTPPYDPPVTFENRADLPPYRNAPISVVLAQRKLHVEERDPPEDGHDGVREEEGPCGERETILPPAYICPQIGPWAWSSQLVALVSVL